jgi:hypothetical protein
MSISMFRIKKNSMNKILLILLATFMGATLVQAQPATDT